MQKDPPYIVQNVGSPEKPTSGTHFGLPYFSVVFSGYFFGLVAAGGQAGIFWPILGPSSRVFCICRLACGVVSQPDPETMASLHFHVHGCS